MIEVFIVYMDWAGKSRERYILLVGLAGLEPATFGL